ncbi:hypothetical protein [Clostridium botulinum]|uniref:Dipeptidyl peptidase IV n=1 Tax=Clostridium botulinum (strain Langeland / NCTC 10281 / Type F) TaxID=441772 RepID=A7GAP0_CLOBL|nr:hypothetical protein [Clostridium botulinum]ABS42175.1 conserved hypothetical protein [Clostridium botulinum F str. Langeland]ADF98312.1 conserved hypothetical protein [Clostridium botulinum F str. 230613]KKM40447.1 hypothetical protein VT72_15130 [Clostridium botulinum]MBY6793313.1 hypothetical protein [Clostridium botulinum]MBY6939122.1 hypothetical protein [Clostridium botulinum]
MKVVKKIILWVMISLTLQFAGLFYIDKYFLASGGTRIKAKKVTNTGTENKDYDVNIPENVEELDVSFNGKYISYFKDNKLNIISTKNGEKKNIEFDSKKDKLEYIWLSDRNRIIYAENKEGQVLLSSYDVDKDQKDKICEFNFESSSAKIEDIKAAPLMNLIYVKVNVGGNNNRLYSVNIMKEKDRVDIMTEAVGDMNIIPHEDILIYEDKINKKIFATHNESSINIGGVTSPKLLSIDDNDNVYIGELKEDEVVKIYYGNVKNNTSTWKALDIPNGAKVKDIYVSPLGSVYVNDDLKGVIKEISTGKETKYSGVMMKMYIDGVASISDGKLVKTKFK